MVDRDSSSLQIKKLATKGDRVIEREEKRERGDGGFASKGSGRGMEGQMRSSILWFLYVLRNKGLEGALF